MVNAAIESRKHNKSIFQNLSTKNQVEKQSINPQKTNIHNLKRLGRGGQQEIVKSPLERRTTQRPVADEVSVNRRFKSVRFNRTIVVQDNLPMTKGSVLHFDVVLDNQETLKDPLAGKRKRSVIKVSIKIFISKIIRIVHRLLVQLAHLVQLEWVDTVL